MVNGWAGDSGRVLTGTALTACETLSYKRLSSDAGKGPSFYCFVCRAAVIFLI